MMDTDFDSLISYYSDQGRSLGIRSAVWSIWEVEDLSSPHPWPLARTLVYQPWSSPRFLAPIKGKTWADLWQSADQVICDSADLQHCFVERFRAREEDPTTLILSTGS